MPFPRHRRDVQSRLIAYILIIYRGFKDKTYGMPLVAFIGNIAWEFIFGLGIESGCAASWSSCPAAIIQARNFIWLLFDFVILYTVLKYGRRYFTGFINKYFYVIVIGGILVAGWLIYNIVQEFWIRNIWGVVINGSTPDYLSLTVQGGSGRCGSRASARPFTASRAMPPASSSPPSSSRRWACPCGWI